MANGGARPSLWDSEPGVVQPEACGGGGTASSAHAYCVPVTGTADARARRRYGVVSCVPYYTGRPAVVRLTGTDDVSGVMVWATQSSRSRRNQMAHTVSIYTNVSVNRRLQFLVSAISRPPDSLTSCAGPSVRRYNTYNTMHL